MSIPDRVAYGRAPRKPNFSCIDDRHVAEALGDIYDVLYVLGNPYIPDEDRAEDLPQSNPPRNKIRFRTTGSMSGQQADAVVVDGAATDISGEPAIVVHDSMDRYTGAGSGKFGWAEYLEYPDDTYRWEIISLGGEGTVTGTSDDEKVGVTASDTPGYLLAKFYTGGDWASAPAYNSSNHQVVWFDDDGTTGDEFVKGYTSKLSTAESFKVKVNSSDTTEQFLEPSFHADNTGAGNYVPADHSAVSIETVVDSPAAGERQLRLYVDRSLETGRVKVTSTDGSLEYLEAKYLDKTDDSYDGNIHTKVYPDIVNDADVRWYVIDSELDDKIGKSRVAKLTSTIAGRSGGTFTSATGVSIGYTVSGVYTEETTATVYNMSQHQIYVESTEYLPVLKIKGEWILCPTQLAQVKNFADATEQHLVHCASQEPEWAADAPVTDIQLEIQVDNTGDLEFYTFCDGWTVVASTEEC